MIFMIKIDYDTYLYQRCFCFVLFFNPREGNMLLKRLTILQLFKELIFPFYSLDEA